MEDLNDVSKNNDLLKNKTQKCFTKVKSGFDPKGHVVDSLFQEGIITAKIYSEISINNCNLDMFQIHLDAIHNWAKIWKIDIFFSKCNLNVIGNLSAYPDYKLSKLIISKVDNVRDLGFCVENKLNFKIPIKDITTRAKQRSALIFRGFLSRNTCHFILAYKSFIRPLLEYASPVWSPSFICLNDEIESVQRSFTKHLPGLCNLTYIERLTKLQIQSLEHRRLVADLVTCFNIIHGWFLITSIF